MSDFFNNTQLQPNDPSLLSDLLPDARRLAETMITQRPSPVRADLMAFLTEANVDGVRIVQGEKGGYLAQILLKDLPFGLPRLVGTDRRTPHMTRPLATDHLRRMLAEVVRSKPPACAPESLFRLSNQTFVLRAEELLAASQQRVTVDEAQEQLEAVYKKYFTDKERVGSPSWQPTTLSVSERQEIGSVLHQAAVNGILEYPPHSAGDPVPPDPYEGLSVGERRAAESADATRRFMTNRDRIFDVLTAAGAKMVMCTYSGSGDDGNIDDVEADGCNLTGIRTLVETREYRHCWNETIGSWGFVAVSKEKEVAIKDAIEALCWDRLEELHGGWEINDGADGVFEFDVAKRTIALTHNQVRFEYTTSRDMV
jgi:uncharacterized protein DUF6878